MDTKISPWYNKNGMQPAVWGPPLWFFLHTMSFNYPAEPTLEQKVQYLTFFKTLGYVLPCKHCRDAYQAYTKNLDLNAFKDRMALTRWVYNLHNAINAKLGKLSSPSFESVVHAYDNLRGGKPKKRTKVVVFDIGSLDP